MATFPQWLERYPEHKRLMYICGEDKALVDYVYTAELQSREINELDFVALSGRDKIAAIMAELDQFAKSANGRIVVIRESDRVKKWEPVITWCNNVYMRNTTLLCVGDEVKPDTNQEYLRPFIQKGRYVECKPLDEAQLKQFVMARGDITSDGARVLIELLAGDVFRILNELRKLEFLGVGTVTAELVEKVVEPRAQDVLVDALFTGQRERALQCARQFDVTDYPLLIGTLEYHLGNMIMIAGQGRYLKPQELASRTGIPIFLIPRYGRWARLTNLQVLYRRVKVLANLDKLYRMGNTIGIVERMILLW